MPFFPPTLSSVVQFWLPHVNRALFPVLTGVTPGLLLMYSICFKVQPIVHSETLVHSFFVMSGYLSYFSFLIA